MARTQRLTKRFIERVTDPGNYGDGGRGSHGLILRVKPREGGGLRKHFVQRLRIGGKPTHLGVGPYPVVTLEMARELAIDNLRTVRLGGDPRQGQQMPPYTAPAQVSPALPVGPSFERSAAEVIALHAPGWTGTKTRGQWEQTFRDHVNPRIGHKAVGEVTSQDVMAILVPMWATMRPTAKRTAQRVSAVFAWAIGQGLRSDDPVPAVLRALPRNGEKVEHRASTPHADLADALRRVGEVEASLAARLATGFLALTGVRMSEALGAGWGEVDIANRVWTIPASRTKTRSEAHTVPLSGAALDILIQARQIGTDGLIFANGKGGQLAQSTVVRVYKAADPAATVHGLRSSFSSWAAEQGIDRELAEGCLGHTVKGVRGAYMRSDLLERRRDVMQDWATYIT